MILTVTANAALDRVLYIREFQPTTNMRTQRVVESVGGKGYDTSVVLQALGVPNLALGFMAGTTGRQLKRLLDNYGIRHDLIWVEGDTRTAHVIVETDFHRHSHIVTQGYSLSASDLETFLARYREQVGPADWVAGAGSLPAGLPADFYGQVTEIAHQSGARALIDCPGEPAIQSIPARPDILKMNRAEFASTFGIAAGDTGELEAQARGLLEERGLPALVVTGGELGVLAVLAEASYQAAAPKQQAVNAAGAGDAVSAALAWRLGLGDAWPDALRWAAAASAAVVLTEGTADCRMEDVHRIYPLVSVERIR
jgi:1-phosphofructokinase family hexose kinase